MSKKLIAKLRGDRDEYIKTADELAARLESGEELSETESKTLGETRGLASELNVRIGELQEQETARLKAGMRDAEFDQLQEQASAAAAAKAEGRVRTEERPTFGQAFTSSQVFADYKQTRGGTSGTFTAQFNLISSVDVNGKPFAGVTKVEEAPMPYRATPLLDACMPIEVGTNDYFWEEWPVSVPSAGDVAEGAAKPEANIVPVNRTGKLGKAAHHIIVTEEALEDNTGFKSRIDTELIDGVRQRGEEKAIAALIAATLPTATHDTLMKAIRVGIAQVQMAGFGTAGGISVALNPLDYAEIDIELLALTLQGARRESPLWNASIIPAGAVGQGTAYVGDIYRGMRKFYRKEADARMSDSHLGLFLENKYVVVAEQRLSVHVVRPEAIAECSAVTVP